MKPAYRPEIDGLRAIAVVPVILFHAGFEFFSGGYTGVDVFFVISGYLITSIIYSELKANKFSITTFYERRARRILPLLFCVVMATLPFAWISLYQIDMIDYFESLIAVPLFSSNLLFVFEADYFDTAVDLKPLLHTWSLAVEEQYYVFFPVFMILSWKYLKQKTILPLIIGVGVFSFILSEIGSTLLPKFNFFLLPTRTWELAIGAVLAMVVASRANWYGKLKARKNLGQLLSVIGLSMILTGIFFIDEETPFPSAYALLPTIGSMLVIAFAGPNNVVGKMLSFRPLVAIGLISYSAYLWHHPLFAFAKHLSYAEISLIQKSTLCTLVFPLSYLSWRFVENPFRDKKRFSRSFIFTFSIIGSLFLISVGVIGVFFDGFPNRAINTKLAIRKYNPDNRKMKTDSWANLRKAKKAIGKGSWFEPENDLPNLLLVGNSHSKDVYNAITHSKQALGNFEIGQQTFQVSDLSNINHKFYASDSYRDAEIILIASHYRQIDLPHLTKLVERFLANEKKVTIAREIHNFEEINGKTTSDIIIERYLRNGLDLSSDSIINEMVDSIQRTYYRHLISTNTDLKAKSDAIIDSISIKYPEVVVLDRMKYVCNDSLQRCFAIDRDLQKYFYDLAHNSIESAEFFGNQIDEVGWMDEVVILGKN